jgi:hypothetical protein
MTARSAAQPCWSAAIVLTMLAAPGVAAENASQKLPRAVAEASQARPRGADIAADRPVGSSDAELEARYGAARKAAEQREREWDRKMKQLTKDVCTGC